MQHKKITYNGEEIELTSFGINSKIKANIFNEEIMRKIGFTDFRKEIWTFSRMISFPKIARYKGFEISFNVSIDKSNPNNIEIDILDEDFCQPYDYQHMLEKNPTFEPAIIVQEQVEKWMKYLEDNRVLTGHVYGEYI